MTTEIKTCQNCKNILKKNEFIKCCSCASHYDLDCAVISEKRYNLMTAENKGNWKCRRCYKAINNDIQPQLTEAHATTSYPDNVTIRKLRPRYPSETYISNTSFTQISSSLSNSNTQLDYSIRSLPTVTNLNSSLLEDLQEQLETCKIELESAHEEVSNLLSENTNLKKIIEDKNKQISVLRNLVTEGTTTTRQSPKNRSLSTPISKRKLNILLRTPRVSPIYLNKSIHKYSNMVMTETTPLDNNDTHKTAERQIPKNINNMLSTSVSISDPVSVMSSKDEDKNIVLGSHLPQILNDDNLDLTISKPVSTISALEECKRSDMMSDQNKEQLTSKKSQLLIFGSQQCAQLGSKLTKRRENQKTINSYHITSFIKSYAKTDQILNSLNCFELSQNDTVVLSVGENDTNPTKMMIDLTSTLNHLQKFNVNIYILSTISHHLNEGELNLMLKNISNNYKNCKYVDVHTENYSVPQYVEYISNRINFIIECNDYENKFIKNIKDCVRVQKIRNVTTTTINNSTFFRN